MTKLCISCKNRQSYYNKEGEKSPLYCSDCKEPDMVNVKNKKCIVCLKKIPNFGNIDQLKASHCANCKEPQMVDIRSKKCIICKKKQPSYNYEGKIPTHCKDCKLVNMIDVISKLCIVCNKNRPVYSLRESDSKGIYSHSESNKKVPTHCSKCKTDEMDNVNNIKCIDCKLKIPSFNKLGEFPRYCIDCKTEEMVNVRSEKCNKCGITEPSFNIEGHPAKFCAKCKTSDMVDVKSPKCATCKKVCASFNIKGQKAKFCNNCKTSEMINVFSKKCTICGLVEAYFNNFGEQRAYCFKCKTPEMVDVKSKECEHGKKRQHCIICTPSRVCKNCKQIQVNKNSFHHPYCFNCFCVLNPDIDIPRKYKIKENYVKEYLIDEFKENITMIFDKKIENGCSLRRPDVLIDFGIYVVIVECDEEQHKNYSCENKRMMEIFQDVGNRSCIFIRFNPDNYKKENKKYKSCFSTTISGLKVNEEEFKRRMKEVVNIIDDYKKGNCPTKEVTIIQLFYDE